ncbi:glycosyltransferase [Aquitalea sp. S1-19]|nr:glycosyltransferase [Aquitalea sp. S1-19]
MHKSAPRTTQTVLSPRFLKLQAPLSDEAQQATVVIGICVRNQAKHLPVALASAMSQQVMRQGMGVVVILDDASDDEWQASVKNWLHHPRVVVVNGLCGSAARARNALLDWVDAELPSACWVARLDADDLLVDHCAVAALIQAGEAANARYVLGSNHLSVSGQRLPVSNIADPAVLQHRPRLLAFIEAFCLHEQQQELPSCNLLLRTQSGIRYPDVTSAEDHWLVAELLMLQTNDGIVVSSPVYAEYSLGGFVTEQNRRSTQWYRQRQLLASAAKNWQAILEQPVTLLGVGQEGIVWREQEQVCKQFYPAAMDDNTAEQIQQLIANTQGPVPAAVWHKQHDGCWSCCYLWFDSTPLPTTLPAETVRHFLQQLHHAGYVTSNIKRSNLRLADGQLVYIDIGKDIAPFTPSRFLDTAARLYGIGILGWSDYELARRPTTLRQHETLASLHGFTDFYRELVESLFPHCVQLDHTEQSPLRIEQQVTLLIKCCAQDSEFLAEQVRHIVSQLTYPIAFASTVLLIDPYTGPFLRQFTHGDLVRVQAITRMLLEEGTIDEVWQAPTAEADIRATYHQWFGRDDIATSHTSICAPLFSQLWAFDRVRTPYVLQCDSDTLVGRRDLTHDFLADMLAALSPDDVVSVGFNIPQSQSTFKPYQGMPGQFPPEVRCGLLHLSRLRRLCPLPNGMQDGRFTLMWHRSVQQAQAVHGSRSLRGGDRRSFYLHPQNSDKSHPDFSIWRDLIAQGQEPLAQQDKWDLLPEADWRYPPRHEALVFLLKGRCTSIGKLRRCFASLAMQHDQRFGLIVIDDASAANESWMLPHLLGTLLERTTLIRRSRRHGYIPNFLTAVTDICTQSDTLVVTLDLDDALMSPEVVGRLYQAIADGVDLVHGVMFRPDKPLQLYQPDYQAPRRKGGGNVWTHLRGFRKRLFDALPVHYLQYQGEWVGDVADYAVMLPLTELAQQPWFIDDLFCYYHQREPYSASRKTKQKAILDGLLSLPPADVAEPASDVASRYQ